MKKAIPKYPDPEADALADKDGNESFITYLLYSPKILAFALVLAIIGAALGFQFLKSKQFAERVASQDSLSGLTTCGKVAANKVLLKGKLLTNADLEKIRRQCSQPANTTQDQAEALSF